MKQAVNEGVCLRCYSLSHKNEGGFEYGAEGCTYCTRRSVMFEKHVM